MPLPFDMFPAPKDDWNHPVVRFWLAFGVSPDWLRLWGFRLPEDKQ